MAKLRKVLSPAKPGSIPKKKVKKVMAEIKQEKVDKLIRGLKKLIKYYDKELEWHSVALKIEEEVAKYEGKEFP